MIALNRRRTMGKKNLPYDAEIEYLESTGTQWIDTGISGDSIYGLEFIFTVCDFSHTPYTIYASILSCQLDDFTVGYYGDKTLLYLRSRGKEVYAGYVEPSEGNILITNNKATINGRIFQIDTPIAINSQNLFIANNSAHSRPAVAKYKRLKIYQDVLIRDLIPVRVGQVGYLYDKVSGQLFGNSGTGNFILGPDK